MTGTVNKASFVNDVLGLESGTRASQVPSTARSPCGSQVNQVQTNRQPLLTLGSSHDFLKHFKTPCGTVEEPLGAIQKKEVQAGNCKRYLAGGRYSVSRDAVIP